MKKIICLILILSMVCAVATAYEINMKKHTAKTTEKMPCIEWFNIMQDRGNIAADANFKLGYQYTPMSAHSFGMDNLGSYLVKLEQKGNRCKITIEF